MPASPPASAALAAANVRPAPAEPVFYPDSDGKPLAENMWQGQAILNAMADLMSAHPDAMVAMDIFVYPEEGNNRNSIVPDVLVGLGLGAHPRKSYYVWVEGKPPDWVLEVASPSTQAEDRGPKRRRYAEIGVREYWLFDAQGGVYPRGTPDLQGLALVDGEYVALPPRVAEGRRMIRSEVLGLDVYRDGQLLRFRDAATGEEVRHWPELEAEKKRAQRAAEREAARAEREAARASREAAGRAAAEARVAELEAALRRRSS